MSIPTITASCMVRLLIRPEEIADEPRPVGRIKLVEIDGDGAARRHGLRGRLQPLDIALEEGAAFQA